MREIHCRFLLYKLNNFLQLKGALLNFFPICLGNIYWSIWNLLTVLIAKFHANLRLFCQYIFVIYFTRPSNCIKGSFA